ncbi:MAG: hypothetical protein J6M62_07725 [Selenomonadaceae bacterium]|nr:hypothetical protein [Selenomonadaceae bacterium]
MAENTSNTPFDDAYRTLSAKGTRLMIPLINYMFHQKYSMDVPITLLNNETNEDNSKAITDSRFMVGDNHLYNIFIIEEQTNLDKDIPYRLYDYMLRHALSHLSKMYKNGKIILPSVGVLNLRDDNKDIKPMTLVHTNSEIDVTMKDISMQNVENLEKLAENKLYCLMPFYAFMMEKRLRNSDTEEAKKLYLQELSKYRDIIEKAKNNGDLIADESYTLDDIRQMVIDGLKFEKDGLNTKELEKMGGRIVELEHEKRFREGQEKAEFSVFQNLMTPILKKHKNIEDGKRLCNTLLPNWGMAKINSKVAELAHKLNVDLGPTSPPLPPR